MTASDAMFDAYIECALWSSTDDACDPLDDNYGPDDIAPDTLVEMRAECDDFLSYCEGVGLDLSDLDDSQIGHDFWLTRNGHGVGFGDRGLGKLGDDLTDAAKSWGGAWLYVGDDGLVHA